MEYLFLFHVFTFLSVGFVACYAALPSEVYWHSVLPNTPIPKALGELLPHERTEVGLNKASVEIKFTYSNKRSPNANQLQQNPNSAAFFFLQKDLYQGKKLNLHFTKPSNTPTFLPRGVANSIPFSSNKLPQILNHFSINPNSEEAHIIKSTIDECESASVAGEEKFCATSLEAMVDFSISKLGKRVKAISTEVGEENSEEKLQKYTIVGVKSFSEGVITCHKQNYVYAVFYCHKTPRTNAYLVSMVDSGGAKASAVAVCHLDTKAWDTKYIGFQVLKVKPGTIPICHFLPEDHVTWVPY